MRKLLPLMALALLLGCPNKDDSGSDSGTDTITQPPAGMGPATFVVNDRVQTAVQATWTTDQPGTSFVEYGLEGAFDQVTESTESGTDHQVSVIFLKSSEDYTMRPVTVLDDGTRLEGPSVTVEMPAVPRGMPRLLVSEVDATRSIMANSLVLFTTLGASPCTSTDDPGCSYLGIADGEGDWVLWQDVDPTGRQASARARYSLDGKGLHYNIYEQTRAEDEGGLRTVSFDGLDYVETRHLWSHHDFVEPEPGVIAWLGYDLREVVVEHGEAGPPEQLTNPDEPQPVAGDKLYEAPLGITDADTPREVMNNFDDHDLAPSWICNHVQKKGSFVPGYFDWTHTNSLAYVPEENAYYMASRYPDAMLKIDRASGEVLWQMGGDGSDFTFDDSNGGRVWNHAHLSHVWEGGMLVFDNRDHDEGGSRVVEYAWDENARTYEQVWEHVHPDDAKLLILGDARRLSNGNTFIAWSAKGELEEITPAGETVWKANFELGAAITRVMLLESRTE